MAKVRVICSTSPIIGLLAINRLELLEKLFDEIYIPEAVYRELCINAEKYSHEVEQIRKKVESGIFVVYQVKNADMVKKLYGRLHYGELEVIVGAKELDIPLAIIDETNARKMASEFLVDTLGILGIVTQAKRKGLIKEVKSELDVLRKSGYRISDKLYYSVLEQNGELNRGEGFGNNGL